MKSNNFIDTTADDYYLNPYKFTKNNTGNIKNTSSDSNLNYMIKTLTSIIMNNSELVNDGELTNNNKLMDRERDGGRDGERDGGRDGGRDGERNGGRNGEDNRGDKLAIFKLIANDNIDKLIKLLANNHNNLYNINAQDNDGDTALHIAIFLSNYDACKVLMQYNANIYIKDKWGQTPLHRTCFALENKNIIKIIELINQKQKYFLCVEGSDNIFNNCDKFNNTSLHLVIKYILKNKIKLNKNILAVLHKLISLTDIEIKNDEGLSCNDLLNMLPLHKT